MGLRKLPVTGLSCTHLASLVENGLISHDRLVVALHALGEAIPLTGSWRITSTGEDGQWYMIRLGPDGELVWHQPSTAWGPLAGVLNKRDAWYVANLGGGKEIRLKPHGPDELISEFKVSLSCPYPAAVYPKRVSKRWVEPT